MKHFSAARLSAMLSGSAALFVLACGGADGPAPVPTAVPATPTTDATATHVPATAVPPTPTATATPEGFYLPETPLKGLVLDGYAVRGAVEATYLTTDLPIVAGTASAWWYQSLGRYVAVFNGVHPEAIGSVCPGASIETGGSFEYVSNAPTVNGACDGATVLAEAPAGAYRCEDFLVYMTEIPAGIEGRLYGFLERFVDGTTYGVTGRTRGDIIAVPELDMTECLRLPSEG